MLCVEITSGTGTNYRLGKFAFTSVACRPKTTPLELGRLTLKLRSPGTEFGRLRRTPGLLICLVALDKNIGSRETGAADTNR